MTEAGVDGDDGGGTADGDPDGGAGADGPGFAWSEGAPCPLARFEANGTVVNGELWVLGGFTSAALAVTRRVDLYDPVTDAWRAGPDLPGAETHIGVVTVGSDLIVFGGFTGGFAGPRPPPTSDVWRWNAAEARWDAGPSLPTPGAAFAWALLGTQLHLAGGLAPDGRTDSAAHLAWDLAGAAAWTSLSPLPNPRNHGGGTAAGGRFYAVAGRHSWDEIAGDVFDLNVFDPAEGSWTARAPIPTERSEIAASTSTMPDGRILVIGGSLPGVRPSADVLVYDPTLDAWSSLPSLPAPRKGAVATRIGPRIIVTTGSPTSIDPSATTWIGCCL